MTFTSNDNENTMFYGASPAIFKNAQLLRDNPTEAEEILWKKLKKKQLGVKFRRQHPINTYIADFYCHEKKLVIEIDGGYHLEREQREYDELRSEDILKFGIKVIRYSNEHVLKELDKIINEIKDVIGPLAPNP